MAYNPSLLHLVLVIVVLNCSRMIADSIPTVNPVEAFDPENDAIRLHEGITNSSRLKQTIIDIFPKRVRSQRSDIVDAYKRLYGKNFLVEIGTKLREYYYQTVVEALLIPLPRFFAYVLYNANTFPCFRNIEDIIEILCTQSDSDLQKTMTIYKELSTESFRDSNRDFIGSNILRMCVDNRNETESVDENLAYFTAKEFVGKGKLKKLELWDYIRLVMYNSHQQFRRISGAYESITERDFEVAMKEDLTDDSIDEFELRRIVRSIKSTSDFFAERLHATLRDNPDTFTRIIVSRSELDLGDIKETFQKRYHQTLEDYVIERYCDDHKFLLLSLISPGYDIREIREQGCFETDV